MTAFLLVHGAWHGGWVWGRVARLLREAGHDVFTPTLSGCGERSHLSGLHINLSLHIKDIENVISWEDLDNFVLVGHSYGCAVVSAVADRKADQIRALACIDGFMPKHGESVWDHTTPKHPYFLRGAGRQGGLTEPIPSEEFAVNATDLDWVKSKVVPMSMACFTEQLTLTGAVESIPSKSYVHCSGWGPSPFGAFHDQLADNHSWKVMRVACGHHWMIDAPEDCATFLMNL